MSRSDKLNELTLRFIGHCKCKGYNLVEISEVDGGCQDITLSSYQNTIRHLESIGVNAYGLRTDIYFYVQGDFLTPGEYELTPSE